MAFLLALHSAGREPITAVVGSVGLGVDKSDNCSANLEIKLIMFILIIKLDSLPINLKR